MKVPLHYFLFTFLLFPLISFSQCPPDGHFTSQAEIDALAIDYPDCTQLGNLIVEGDDINELSGLEQLIDVGRIFIRNNPLLVNLQGLNANLIVNNGVCECTVLTIENNSTLENLDGLSGLSIQTDVETGLYINDNPMLTSLEGLPNSFNSLTWLTINNNDSLLNLNGLESYNPGESLSINDNDLLTDLTGLVHGAQRVYIVNNDNLETLNSTDPLGFSDILVINNNASLADISALNDWYIWLYGSILLSITENPNLSNCSITKLCEQIADTSSEGMWFAGTFENNAPGCNNNAEVEYGCGFASNDDCIIHTCCSDFIDLGETIIANNEFATTSSRTPTCNEVTDRKDVFFLFNSDESNTIDIITQAGFSLQLWELVNYPCAADQSPVENGCGSEMLLDIGVTPNTEYLIQVWSDVNTRLASNSSSMPPGYFTITVQDGSLSTQEDVFSGFSLFPNPTNSTVNLKSTNAIETIEVYNLLGQRILNLAPNTLTEHIDMSQYNSGMYLIKVIIGEQSATYKVVKE